MNRIVIIGNGFDKAHGLPTRYAEFLDFLRDSIAKYEEENNRLVLKVGGEVSRTHPGF